MSARAGRKGPPGSIRIIGGQFRGRKIALAAIPDLRPTPSRVRETLFNWLAPQIAGARCLDLFAGSGALGIEALSRGAAEVVFVESNAQLVRQLEGELDRLNVRAMVARESAFAYLQRYAGSPFDVVFLDPPYQQPVDGLFDQIESRLAAHGRVYLERPRNAGLPALDWASWVKRGQAASVCFGLAGRA